MCVTDDSPSANSFWTMNFIVPTDPLKARTAASDLSIGLLLQDPIWALRRTLLQLVVVTASHFSHSSPPGRSLDPSLFPLA